jgi:integrase
LCFLKDKDRAISTIEGYRTAIAKVLRATKGLDIGKDTDITTLLANFHRNTTATVSTVPSWDLALVLNMLTRSPFEPMHLADLKFVTLKTVFLLALASGKRRSEIHALQVDIQRTENWSEISIFPDINFIPKTQLVTEGAAPLKPLTLKALTKIVGPDLQEDRSLCVVRALRYYLKTTKDVRKGRKRFFIAMKKGHEGDICRHTISSWLKKTILLAYAKSSSEVQQIHRVKAHDVRAMASSWAFLKNVSLDAILQACSWRSHTTFTNFYLKDLTRIQDDLLKLAPFVSAQH